MTITIFVWDHKIKGKQKKKGALLGSFVFLVLWPIIKNPPGEHEWDFYFWNLTCVIVTFVRGSSQKCISNTQIKEFKDILMYFQDDN